jgi:hypothetical protein
MPPLDPCNPRLAFQTLITTYPDSDLAAASCSENKNATHSTARPAAAFKRNGRFVDYE